MLLEDGEARRRPNKRELVETSKMLLEDEGDETRPRGCKYTTPPCVLAKIGTLRYEDGKASTATAVDAGNFRGSRYRRVAKNKILKMCIFAKDGDVNNSNLVQAFHRSNDVH